MGKRRGYFIFERNIGYCTFRLSASSDPSLSAVPRHCCQFLPLPLVTRHHLAIFYRRERLRNPNLCQGLIDPRFVMDYRCVLGRILRTRPGVQRDCTLMPAHFHNNFIAMRVATSAGALWQMARWEPNTPTISGGV